MSGGLGLRATASRRGHGVETAPPRVRGGRFRHFTTGFGRWKPDRLRRLGLGCGWECLWTKDFHARRTGDGGQEGPQDLVLIGDGQAAIHGMVQIDARAGVTAAVGGGR